LSLAERRFAARPAAAANRRGLAPLSLSHEDEGAIQPLHGQHKRALGVEGGRDVISVSDFLPCWFS